MIGTEPCYMGSSPGKEIAARFHGTWKFGVE